MFEGATAQVNSSVGMSEGFPVRVGLHQGSALSPYLFDLIIDVVSEEVRGEPPWCMLFADDIVLVGKTREELSEELTKWRRALESRGFRISRSKTEYIQFNLDEEGEVLMDV